MKKPYKSPISKAGFFPKFLIDQRLKAGFSQNELARVLGWKNGQYISNVERSLTPFPSEKLPLLAKVLGVPLEKLIGILGRDFVVSLHDRLKA